ncbi:hypothetical protein M2475_002201 [Breznakia sp. PF5-3]|uniref:hypothetical protein n=1 Tax=unclassified Breznakia TaxID=2623764 RepID=UPI002406B99D|nr:MULTISPECIES: hypothetical protein [unclassified Breznakia]MDL2276726.1 hypothetical protein [Breznakia sp. OttesenSCG-928-G09]MDF9825815.1 hypothetical protein [Breznakia sp. PM6-1]MDF9836620.1 hypothetical protein [Breznakia sp. PF5-3]MDF9838857.1 hypothetical protein [Breznakia sp. PFB2-8]MDF9860883.1 hypothetical protein [Breznakia sp. PH5-24]
MDKLEYYEVVIEKTVMKESIDMVEKTLKLNGKPSMLFWSLSYHLDPDKFEYVEKQWQKIRIENALPPEERISYIFSGYGDAVYEYGDWIVNTKAFPKEENFAFIVCDGIHKPIVFFHMVNSVELGKACFENWPTTVEETKNLIKKHLVQDLIV